MASLAFGRHKVSTSAQAIVSRPDVPRSTFKTAATHKTTFDVDYLIPIYVEEILPGDTLNLDMTAFVRMATPIFPTMDNLYVDTFWFFVPNRLVWWNWNGFMGEKYDPGDDTEYTMPQVLFEETDENTVGSIFDYMGIPPFVVPAATEISFNALPFRAYQLIWSEWFRDQFQQDYTQGVSWGSGGFSGDGPDPYTSPRLLKRGKRHDYFTSALPWPQAGTAVSLPLTGNAPIMPIGPAPTFTNPNDGPNTASLTVGSTPPVLFPGTTAGGTLVWDNPQLEADLTDVLAVSINTMRAAVAMQQLLEREARFGNRYTETLRGMFGVDAQDYRLQRPEYLGGSSTPISITPVAQTSAPPEEGDTPIGNLGAAAVAVPRARINATFPEHGYCIGLINVRADISYQQGVHRMWTRRTRFDFAWPIFANLGEQAVRQDELYFVPDPTENEIVFGYQERYAEYRYRHSLVTSMFRSGISGTLDSWHLAEEFSAAPTLDANGGWIEANTPLSRALAAGDLANGQQFYADILFRQSFTRPLPVRGTPGLVRL